MAITKTGTLSCPEACRRQRPKSSFLSPKTPGRGPAYRRAGGLARGATAGRRGAGPSLGGAPGARALARLDPRVFRRGRRLTRPQQLALQADTVRAPRAVAERGPL